MNAEIQEYMGMANEFHAALENQYQLALVNGDIQAAYNVIGDLMAYKLIDETDPRIQKNNTSYTKYGIDKSHRFRLDYRSGVNYIPEWLFGKLQVGKKFNINSVEHIGKRVEGNYSGDTVFPSHVVTISIKQCSTVKQVENAFDEMGNILKAAKSPINLNAAYECAKHGVYRVYRIEVEGNCISRFRTIGFAIIAMQASGMVCSLIMKYDSIIENWLQIDEMINMIQKTICTICNNTPVFAYPIDAESSRKSQRGLIEQLRVVVKK